MLDEGLEVLSADLVVGVVELRGGERR